MEILKKYVSKDSLRPALMEVRREDDYLYATDCHIIARLKSDKEIETKYSFNGLVNIFFESDNEYEEIDINVLTEISGMPRMIIMQESGKTKLDKCDECSGVGTVEWIYEDSSLKDHEMNADCPICYGAGESEQDILLEKEIIKNDLFVTYKSHYFNPNLVLKIFSEVKVNPKIRIGINNMLQVKMGDYEFTLMPMYDNGCLKSHFDLADFLTTK